MFPSSDRKDSRAPIFLVLRRHRQGALSQTCGGKEWSLRGFGARSAPNLEPGALVASRGGTEDRGDGRVDPFVALKPQWSMGPQPQACGLRHNNMLRYIRSCDPCITTI